MHQIRTRFAPSPTGFVHVGSLYSALFAYAFAKSHQGAFIVRLEDTDRERYVEGADEVLFAALAWVGFQVDESSRQGGASGPYVQSERLPLYQQYAHQLVELGEAYYAFETEAELATMRQQQLAAGETPRYDRRALKLTKAEVEAKLAAEEPYVIRLKVPADREVRFTDLVRGEISFNTYDIDDQVLLKSDGFPTYHLAVVVDDHLMGISHVIRAEEWISSTPKHILIYEAFGWEVPRHAHLPIIRNPDKSKMSKRHGHADLRWYKEQGYLPEALVNYLCLLGWSHPEEKEVFSLEEFIANFSFERIKTSAPIFDLEKLTWLNGVYVREMGVEDLVQRLVHHEASLKNINRDYLTMVVALEQERLHTLSEFKERASFFFNKALSYSEEVLVQKGRDKQGTVTVLEKSLESVNAVTNWCVADLEMAFDDLIAGFKGSEAGEWKKKDLLMTIRGAISGQTATPPLFDTLYVLGKERVSERINAAINYLLHE